MHNLALIGIVLAGAVSAVAASILCVGVIWVIADHCEDFRKNPWDTDEEENKSNG